MDWIRSCRVSWIAGSRHSSHCRGSRKREENLHPVPAPTAEVGEACRQAEHRRCPKGVGCGAALPTRQPKFGLLEFHAESATFGGLFPYGSPRARVPTYWPWGSLPLPVIQTENEAYKQSSVLPYIVEITLHSWERCTRSQPLDSSAIRFRRALMSSYAQPASSWD